MENGRHRPFKIILDSAEERERSENITRMMFLKPDYQPKEHAKMRALRKEIATRIAAREKSLLKVNLEIVSKP